MPVRNLVEQQFGRLKVLSRAGKRKHGQAQWLCVCECGTQKVIDSSKLIRGTTRSCGCLAQELRKKVRHGHCASGGMTSERNIWSTMRQRCSNKNNPSYKNYGGRGITVCERWSKFENFLADMGYRPSKAHTIERIDNRGNYEPSNCFWATRLEQANNKRNNRYITARDRTMTISQWAREANMRQSTLWYRLKAGWSVDEAVSRKVSFIPRIRRQAG